MQHSNQRGDFAAHIKDKIRLPAGRIQESRIQERGTEIMENEMDLHKIEVDDAFWATRQKLITDTVIPYQEKILNDEIPGIEKSHALANFRIAAGLEEGEFYGMVFQDSDVAKWLEGVAYSLILHPDAALEKRADDIIAVIEKAQQPDGYLDTYFILKEPEHKWQNLQECHELYCAGHMMEAAVAYYEATGKDTLLKVMERVAACIDAHIGPEEGKIHGVPGHEEVEIGLLRMYRVTGNPDHLRLAKYFIDQRGQDPDFFIKETEKRGWVHWGNSATDHDYTQVFAPVRDQHEARGHAVRNVYLLTAMADLAEVTGDPSLRTACDRLFDNITRKQMYITAGIGQVGKWEGFSFDYDLPNDTVYAETCASIGLVFFAHRMLKMKTDRRYSDVMERALYNGVLSGIQLDGQRFFYVNPLEVNPGISGKLPGYEHVLPQRPQWYACACCPPNVVRTVEALGKYAWDEKSADSDTDLVINHLYLGGSIQTAHAKIFTESEYPWNGRIRYTFDACDGTEFTFAFRIPAYVKNARITLNDELLTEDSEGSDCRDGYFYLTAAFADGDTLDLSFEMPVRRIYCNPRVRANEGQVALMRGPLVYSFEGVDNGPALQELRIPRKAAFSVSELEDEKSPLNGMTVLDFTGKRSSFPSVPEDSLEDAAEAPFEELYSEEVPLLTDAPMRAVPYFAWGNRGENQMRVWMHES